MGALKARCGFLARALATLILPMAWVLINLLHDGPALGYLDVLAISLTDFINWWTPFVTYPLLFTSTAAHYGIWRLARRSEERPWVTEIGLSVAFHVVGMFVLFFLTIGLVLGE